MIHTYDYYVASKQFTAATCNCEPDAQFHTCPEIGIFTPGDLIRVRDYAYEDYHPIGIVVCVIGDHIGVMFSQHHVYYDYDMIHA